MGIFLLVFYVAHHREHAFAKIEAALGFIQEALFVSFLGLVWIISSEKWQRFLQLKPLLFLGKISYSVYLVQWLVIFVCINPYFSFFKNLFQTEFLTTKLIMAALVIGFTLVLATLLYYFVELPFINLGRKKLGTDDVIIPRHNHDER